MWRIDTCRSDGARGAGEHGGHAFWRRREPALRPLTELPHIAQRQTRNLCGSHRCEEVQPAAEQAKRSAAAPGEWTVLGKPVPAQDHAALVTGTFQFVQNVRLGGMLHGRVVRPPQMGAKLLSVDEASVSDVHGAGEGRYTQGFRRRGCGDAVRCAASRAQVGVQVAARTGSAAPGHFFRLYAETALARRSERRFRRCCPCAGGRVGSYARSYTYPYQMHGSLATSCAVADVEADSATVWSPTQSVYPTRNCIAMLLNMSPDNVSVIFVRGSGCYGLNGADAVSFDAAVLSQAAGRPVRLQYSRQDEMMWENFGSACAWSSARVWPRTARSLHGIARTGWRAGATVQGMTSRET